MKLSALQQSYTNRRSTSFRGALPLDPSSGDGAAVKSPAALFWLLLHALCCLISLVLGFRFSRLVFFLLFSSSPSTLYTAAPSFLGSAPVAGTLIKLESPENRTTAVAAVTGGSSSRVVVGRHGIRIRPWPHPDPAEVMRAHRIIERVQREQRVQYGIKAPRTLIAVTPTYVRTFQTLHLTGVMHWLMNAPYDVVWIVLEAGGTTNETAALVAKSGLRVVHIGFQRRMPIAWEDRHRLEAQMRLQALRVVRDQKMDGIVVFADDSNVHSLELFDEIQKVRWIGAVSVGILAHSGNADGSSSLSADQRKEDELNLPVPVQGPACNSSDRLVGWHIFNSLPYVRKSAKYIDDRAIVLPRKFEWSGFVLNSRLLWRDAEDKPAWVKDLDSFGRVGEDVESPLSLVKDSSVVEPLGSCGRKILLWWLRVEARTDSKFPPGWIINPPLEITVPAKRTPWPDAPPELPSDEKVRIGTQEHVEKRIPKTRTSRSRRSSRNKRKREARSVDTQVSARHTNDQ